MTTAITAALDNQAGQAGPGQAPAIPAGHGIGGMMLLQGADAALPETDAGSATCNGAPGRGSRLLLARVDGRQVATATRAFSTDRVVDLDRQEQDRQEQGCRASGWTGGVFSAAPQPAAQGRAGNVVRILEKRLAVHPATPAASDASRRKATGMVGQSITTKEVVVTEGAAPRKNAVEPVEAVLGAVRRTAGAGGLVQRRPMACA